MNICHIELANPLTKHTLLVIGQIQYVFNTSRNKSSSPSIEAMQICPQNQVKKCCSLKLDRCIYQDLIFEAQQMYLSRIMKFRFPDLFFMHIQAMCLGFLFSQPQTYIWIILRAVMLLLHLQLHAYCDQRQFALVHISLKEATMFIRHTVL